MKKSLIEQLKIEKTDIDNLYSIFALKRLAEKEIDLDLMYLDEFSDDIYSLKDKNKIFKSIGNILDKKRELMLTILPKNSSLEKNEYCNKEIIVDQLQHILNKYFKKVKMIDYWWKDDNLNIILNFMDFLQYQILLTDENDVLINEYKKERGDDEEPRDFELNNEIKSIKLNSFMHDFMVFAYKNIYN